MSAETLEQRLQVALRAKRRVELAALVSDLPEAHPLARVLAWLRAALQSADEAVATLTPPPTGEPGPFVIGREATCDLFLDDPTVSKHHADLRRTDEGWLLTDVGSRNGTRVNGWRIEDVVLRDGDVVRMGNVSVLFQER
jgi:FHA domain